MVKYAWNLLESVKDSSGWEADEMVLDRYSEQISRISARIESIEVAKSKANPRALLFREKLVLPKKEDSQPQTQESTRDIPQDSEKAAMSVELASADTDRQELLGLRQRKTEEKTDFKDTSNIEHVLQHHREMQDELTEDLARMAKSLKMNSVAFGDMLEKDKSVFETASTALENSYGRLRTEGGRLGEYSSRARGTTWLVYGSVLTVLVCFVFIYLLIKIT